MYHTTLGLSLAESDSSSDTDSGDEISSARPGRTKARKVIRRKKSKKVNKVCYYILIIYRLIL